MVKGGCGFQMSLTDSLEELVKDVPKACVTCCFAYGSGAIAQRNQSAETNMADFIFAVSDSKAFHRENLRGNKKHYSFMRCFGSAWLSRYQQEYGARVYFNTMIRVQPSGRLIKYGVIETRDLIADLYDWESLYVSGRLHKPVIQLFQALPDLPELRTALNVNLKSALHAALLLLPETFTTADLFKTITNLSYNGDFRTIIGEDKNKVANIVDANMSGFHDLYDPVLRDFEQVYVSGRKVVQDLSVRAVYHHLELLPKGILWRIQDSWNRDGRNRDVEEVVFTLAHTRDYGEKVDGAIRRIVFSSSLRQSLKNATTAGLHRTLAYSGRKLLKMIRSLRP